MAQWWLAASITHDILSVHAKRSRCTLQFRTFLKNIISAWCKHLQVLTVLMEQDHVPSQSPGSWHQCCMLNPVSPHCQLFTNSRIVFGSAAMHFWHYPTDLGWSFIWTWNRWTSKLWNVITKIEIRKFSHPTAIRREWSSAQQPWICYGDLLCVSQSKTKRKAIICVLPQGGHFTGNNYVVVARQSCLPIWDRDFCLYCLPWLEL